MTEQHRLDLGRRQRLGMVEAIWGEHKSAEQIARIRCKRLSRLRRTIWLSELT